MPKTSKIDNKDKKSNSKKKTPEKKLKLYCGILNPIPDGYRLGSMHECFNVGKVMYYGIKKVDSIILNSNKKKETDINSLQIKKAGLLGKHNNLKKKYENAKNKEDKDEIKKNIADIVKEINTLTDEIKKNKK